VETQHYCESGPLFDSLHC